MGKEDIQLRCLLNLPIIVDGIIIQAKTINEIIDLGFNNYNQLLGIFSFTTEEILKKTGESLTLYGYICKLLSDKQYTEYVCNLLKYFIGKDIAIYEKVMYCLDGNIPIIINEKTFDEIVHVIKYQNALIKDEEDDTDNENPANDKVKQLLEKRKKVREKLKKAKQKSGGNDEEPLTLLELISVMSCNCQGLNIFNIGQLNLFQFNDQFNRMVLLDNYRVNIRALLAGAKQDELGMENWMKKIH